MGDIFSIPIVFVLGLGSTTVCVDFNFYQKFTFSNNWKLILLRSLTSKYRYIYVLMYPLYLSSSQESASSVSAYRERIRVEGGFGNLSSSIQNINRRFLNDSNFLLLIDSFPSTTNTSNSLSLNFSSTTLFDENMDSTIRYLEDNSIRNEGRFSLTARSLLRFLEDSEMSDHDRVLTANNMIRFTTHNDNIDRINDRSYNRTQELYNQAPRNNIIRNLIAPLPQCQIVDRPMTSLEYNNDLSMSNNCIEMSTPDESEIIQDHPKRELIGANSKSEISQAVLGTSTNSASLPTTTPGSVHNTNELIKSNTNVHHGNGNTSLVEMVAVKHCGELEGNQHTSIHDLKSKILTLHRREIGPNIPDFMLFKVLQRLDLSHNRIEKFDPRSIQCNTLSELVLSHNKIGGKLQFPSTFIDSIDDDHPSSKMSGIHGLRKLDLSFNSILSVNGLSHLPRLTELNLDGNSFTIINETNCEESQLKKLSVTKMKYSLVSFRRNGVPGVPFPRLEELSVDGFPEMAYWQEFPSTLQKFEVYRSRIEYLPCLYILPMTLRVLKLENIDDLKTLPGYFRDHFPDMEELYLPNNRLNSFYNILECIPNRRLNTIDLSGNPIARKFEIQQKERMRECEVHATNNFGELEAPATNSSDLESLLKMVCPHVTTIYILNSKPKN